MIIITKVKNPKVYKMPKMPNFIHSREKIIWLRRQKMLALKSNVKSVSVQVRDIKKMICSKEPKLLFLHSKFYLSSDRTSYSDDDYITITKSTRLNQGIICALLSADWLLDVKVVENKSIEELQQECVELQKQISLLKKKEKSMIYPCDIGFKIDLFEYKLSCLSDIISNRVNLKNDLDTKKRERVLNKKENK